MYRTRKEMTDNYNTDNNDDNNIENISIFIHIGSKSRGSIDTGATTVISLDDISSKSIASNTTAITCGEVVTKLCHKDGLNIFSDC